MGEEDIYRRIGVRPFINCCGTRTIHSGTLMWPCVREAMVEASKRFVNMDELMDGAGARLAELTGAEAAIVTSGGAGALCVAAATAVTGGDPEKILRLPQLDGLKDRVVMLETGRFTYDQAIRAVGVTVVEVSGQREMEKALSDERVAMIALLGSDEAEGRLSLEEIARMAEPRGIPVLVDAASEHLKRPNPYLEAGATMVAYSGGKYLRGPQPTGLLLGSGAWLRAAWTNAAPHHTFGRMMKVGKEEIMGLLAAVEHLVEGRDGQSEAARWVTDLETIATLVTESDGVTAEVLAARSEKSPTPRLEIRWDAESMPVHGLALRQTLLDTEPRIMLDDRFSTEGSVFILPFSLQEGEAEVVGERIAEVLENSRGAEGPFDTPASQTTLRYSDLRSFTQDKAQDRQGAGGEDRAGERENPPTRRALRRAGGRGGEVAGIWSVTISYPVADVDHVLTLEQEGAKIAGVHRTLFQENALRGEVEGRRVRLVSEHRYEGTHLVYTFEGEADGDEMAGRVEVGSEGQSAPGPLNRKEYGSYEWKAGRQ